MQSCKSDTALFFRTAGEKLSALCEKHAGHSPHVGTEIFSRKGEARINKFNSRDRYRNHMPYVGVQAGTISDEFFLFRKVF